MFRLNKSELIRVGTVFSKPPRRSSQILQSLNKSENGKNLLIDV